MESGIKNCQVSGCVSSIILDCEYCKFPFCFGHLETDRHSCKSHFLRQSQYSQVACPICGQLITEYRGEYINDKVDKHIRAGCPTVSNRTLKRFNSESDNLLNNSLLTLSQNEYMASPALENNDNYETGNTIFSTHAFSPKYDDIPSISSPISLIANRSNSRAEGTATSGRVLFPQTSNENDKLNYVNNIKIFSEPKTCTDLQSSSEIILNPPKPEDIKPSSIIENNVKQVVGTKRKKKKEKEVEPLNIYTTKLRLNLSFLSLNDPLYFSTLIKCFVLSLFHSDMHRLPISAALSYFQSGNPYLALPLFKSLENYLQKLSADLLLNLSELALLSLYMAQLNLLPAESYNSTEISAKFKDNLICSAYYVKMTYDTDHSIYIPYLIKLADKTNFPVYFKSWMNAFAGSFLNMPFQLILSRTRLFESAYANFMNPPKIK